MSSEKTKYAAEVDTDIELTPAVISEAQLTDPALTPLISVLKALGPRPAWSEMQSASEETRALWAQFESLKFCENLLYREFYRPDGTVSRMQIVLPRSLRQSFLHQLHDNGGNSATAHLGVSKTQAHVSQRAYWVNWRTDVEQFCRRCTVCRSVQHGAAPKHGKMQLYEPNGAGDCIHVDLTGPHPASRQGSIYILTIIDAFTRYLTAVPLRNKSALTVADALVERVFLPFGCCRSLVSDQGTEFCNDVLIETTKLLGIRKLRTTAYRASANGRVERVHRTLNELMSKVMDE